MRSSLRQTKRRERTEARRSTFERENCPFLEICDERVLAAMADYNLAVTVTRNGSQPANHAAFAAPKPSHHVPDPKRCLRLIALG
jgi:hypothetical protein